MGKYALLLTFSVGLALAYFGQQSMQISSAANEDQVERQKTVLARQIARSAFNRGVSRVRRDGPYIFDPITNEEHNEGEFDLMYPDEGTETDEFGIEWKYVMIRAEGRYPEAGKQSTYRITAKGRQPTPEAGKSIRASVNAITVMGDASFGKIAGPGCKTCINGNDQANEENTLEKFGDRHGISLPSNRDTKKVCNKFQKSKGKKSDNKNYPIVGVGKDCDVISRDDENVSPTLKKIINKIEKLTKREKVVEVTEKGNYENGGEGKILYVRSGEAKIENWNGLVVATGGTIKVPGAHTINGGLFMAGNASFTLRGGGNNKPHDNVQYNSRRLSDLLDILPLLGEPVVITDRCGGRYPFPEDHPCVED